jgi:type II secretory ATPase GspE/PulE/Tfp pilus assembly ATPase PilB-like protein
VLLSGEDYLRQLAHVTLVMEGRSPNEEEWRGVLGGGAGRFPDKLVVPTERSNALHFLIEYYLHRKEEKDSLAGCLKDNVSDELLPAGYSAAWKFLIGDCGVVQIGTLRLEPADQNHIPEPLRKKLSVIQTIDRHIWITAPSLPQSEAEDRIYAELGEGWTLHWLLRAPEESRGRVPLAPPQAPQSAKVVISAMGSTRTPFLEAKTEEIAEREIVLEERKWEPFDFRQRDAQPDDYWRAALFKAVDAGSTDLHFEPGVAVGLVRYRMDGLLEEMVELPADVCEAMVNSLMTQTGLGSDRYRPKDGSFTVRVIGKTPSRNREVRVRSNAYPVRGTTQKIALRLLAKQGEVPPMEALLPAMAYTFMNRAISRSEGLILVCGPTGSGKTTTIFSCLAELNRPEYNITTLENPVEYVIPRINQGEVNEGRQVTWEDLNAAFLRQDPDVGLIGEIRDAETARTVLRLANTGHLVFGSLHTKSCPTSVIRMLDLGASALMLSEALLLAQSQRLVRRVCPRCFQETEATAVEKELYVRHGLAVPKSLRRADSQGCEECRKRGYKGRIAAAEVLPNAPEVRVMIEENAPSREYLRWMEDRGLRTVFENALELAAAGKTTIEEALTLQDAWDGNAWDKLLKISK